MSAFLGIDFGSSVCRTVVFRNGELGTVSNRFRDPVLPWVFSKSLEPQNSPNDLFPFSFRSLKQDLGSLELLRTTSGIHSLADKISEVLGQVREDVANSVGEHIAGAVIATPGFFLDSPRSALREAALSAGFEAVRLLDEGMAAILGAAKPVGRGPVLVYSLGSGVFSATVIAVENGKPRVVSAEGNRLIGGSAFDAALASVILARLADKGDFADPQSAAVYLKHQAEKVKVGLTRREEEVFDLNLNQLFGSGGIARLGIKRSEFEAAISELVDQTIQLSTNAIQAAKIAPSELHSIIAIGESTRIPLIEQQLSSAFPVERVRAGDTEVAKGAAWFGGQIGDENWKRREPSSRPPSLPQAVRSEEDSPKEPPSVRRDSPGQQLGSWVSLFSPNLLRAETQWNSGNRNGAIQTFEATMREMGTYLGTLYHSRGQELFRDHNYVEAIAALESAMRHTLEVNDAKLILKNFHEALNHRSRQLAASGHWQEAWIMIRRALEINQECPGCKELAAEIRHALKVSVPGPSKQRKKGK